LSSIRRSKKKISTTSAQSTKLERSPRSMPRFSDENYAENRQLELFTKPPKTKAVLGIDMGATHMRLCALDEQKNILNRFKIKTKDALTGDISANFTQIIAQEINLNHLNLGAMVIGLPVTISKDKTRVLSTANLKMDTHLFSDLVCHLREEFSCAVSLERDVNLQLAYDVYHAGLEDKIVLGCYLGTGFGFAIWLYGDIYTGAHGVAGELGHIPYGNQAEICVCGNPGCLETIVSGMNLRRFYEKEQHAYPLDLFFTQADNEHFVDYFLQEAAKAIATTINLFDPDAVILGGGVVDMQEFPYNRLKDRVMIHCRKPLPAEQLTLIKAASSSFNGAVGGALQALRMC